MPPPPHFGWPKFAFISENGCRRPIWMNENHFWLVFGKQNSKMAAGQSKWLHFGWPKITFDRISRHFRSICTFCFHKMAICNNFLFCLNGRRRPFWKSHLGHFGWPKITFDHFRSIRNFCFHKMAISNYYYFFIIVFHNMVVGGHFGWQKITFNHISRHFRSICFFFTKWLPAAILDDRKSLQIRNLDFFSPNGYWWPFWSHFSPFQISTQLIFFDFFFKNGCWRPFWMTENHFRWHFSPFQINAQLFIFFTKWLPAAILDDRKSLSIAFVAISDKYATLIFFDFFLQNGCRRPFWMTEYHFRWHFSPFQINAQLFIFFHKMAAGGHLGWPEITFDRISRYFR